MVGGGLKRTTGSYWGLKTEQGIFLGQFSLMVKVRFMVFLGLFFNMWYSDSKTGKRSIYGKF